MEGGGGEVEEGGGSRTNVFGEEAAPIVSLNLTALMDILSNLLFFLLACFGATIVMSINATVPVQSADKNDIAATRQSVTANVTVGASAFDVTIIGSAQTPEELDRWRKRIPPAADGEPDYDALGAHMLAIKQQYPRSDTMILTAQPDVKYEVMIRAMDAARETEVKVSGISRLVPVFPTVVVAPSAAGAK
jgi:biopolymer transport protein ExbD